MDLIQEYFALATSVASFCGYDKKLVAEYNQKVTRMRDIAVKIERNNDELKNAFCELLFCGDKAICLWVSHHILEVMNCEQSYRKIALRTIRKKSKTDKTVNGFGEKVWLKEWYKSHPKDRWVI